MKSRLPQVMNRLHTSIGLLFGWLLFAVFLSGTLTVFDQEITSWRDQLYAASFLLGCVPLLNGMTTNTHLLISIPRGQWEFVGVDLTGLALGGAPGWTGRLIGQRPLKELPGAPHQR